MLNDLYFKTTCNIRPHFLGPVGGLKIEGPLYMACDLRTSLGVGKSENPEFADIQVSSYTFYCQLD